MMTEREAVYRDALQQEFFKMFPHLCKGDPVCSYDCSHCNHHVGWLQLPGGIPQKYTCHSCSRPVQLVFSHYQKHLRHGVFAPTSQTVNESYRKFYASEQYAAFLARHGTLDRIEPDIEDEA